MLIYNEIQTLKNLNENLKQELESLKSDTKEEILNANQSHAKEALDNASKELQKRLEVEISRIKQELATKQNGEVAKLFSVKIDELIPLLSAQASQDFAKQNEAYAKTALDNLTAQHALILQEQARQDISQATKQASEESLREANASLSLAQKLNDELATTQTLEAIAKMRFECALHTSAICAQSQLHTYTTVLAKIAQENAPQEPTPSTNTTHKSYATK